MAKEGTTTGPQKPSYVEYTKLSAARMRRWEKTYKPSQNTLDNIASRTSEKEQWLVFSETWCGDAAHNLPFIAKWAEHAGVDMRIILRDENTELMDEFLTNGGRSIPKLVRLNENFEVLGTWGPRPTPLMEEYAKWKSPAGIRLQGVDAVRSGLVQQGQGRFARSRFHRTFRVGYSETLNSILISSALAISAKLERRMSSPFSILLM